MEGETIVVSPANIDQKNDSSSPLNANYPQSNSRAQSSNIRPNTNASNFIEVPNIEERHTLPEIPHDPLTATVAHVVSKELG